MLCKSNTDNYLFQIIFLYRKTIPSNDLFYFVFFFYKYLGAFLLVHNIKGQEDNLISFESLVKYFTLMSNGMEYVGPYYSYISITIFIFLILFISICVGIIIKIKRSNELFCLSQLTDSKSRLSLSKAMQKTIKCLSYIFLIIIFIAHYISEYLLFSLMLLLYSKESQYDPITNIKAKELEHFISRIQINKYSIVIINLVSVIIIIGLTLVFLLLSSALSLEKNYGFNTNLDIIGISLLLVCFQLQGVYTISCYFFDAQGDNLRFWLCVITLAILIICFVINIKQYNHSQDRIAYFINFSINWCIIAAIVEIIISKAYNGKLTQIESLMKAAFEIINAGFLVILVTRLKRNSQLSQFVHNVFKENNKAQNYNSIEEYAYILANHLYSKKNFIRMYLLFEDHRMKCNNDRCKCHFIHAQLEKKIKKKKNNINELKKVLISMGENEIVSMINRCKDQLIKGDTLNKLFFIHVDYVKTIKQKHFLALYLAKTYQQSKYARLTVFDQYLLYELEQDIVKLFNNRRERVYSRQMNQLVRNTKVAFKTSHKQKKLLSNYLISERLLKQIFNCLSEMEKFAYYRNIVRMNIKTSLDSEEFLKPIMSFTKEYNDMIRLLDNYLIYNKDIPCALIELSYNLTYFFLLFNGDIPNAYKQKFVYLPKFNDYVQRNINANKYMILLLTNDDTILIKAISIRLAEELSYHKEELIDKDIHDLLIPNHLAQNHFIYMKSFILKGNMTMNKLVYIMNKDKYILPYNLSCQILPSISRHLNLIMKAEGYSPPLSNDNRNHKAQKDGDNNNNNNNKDKEKEDLKESVYYLCLDYYFNLLAVSENFTKNFVFTLKMFQILKLNFCTFFGVKQDIVTDYFSKKINKRVKVKGKELRNSIMTTIPHEKKHMYQNVLFYYQNESKYEEKDIEVYKLKAVSCIKRIEKYIDELGLEKEWNEKINDLCERLGNKSSETKMSLKTESIFSSKNDNRLSEKLTFSFTLRNIGNLYYYIVVFHNKMPESTLVKKDQDDLLYKDNIGRTISLSNIRIGATAHDDKPLNYANASVNANGLASSNENSYLDINSKKELNQSSSNNNSNALILNNKNTYVRNDDMIMLKNTFRDSKIAYTKMLIVKKRANMLKTFQLILLVVLIAFNIAILSINASFVSIFVNMFNINSYSFLLSADVFFTSLGCLRVCLIKEKIQSGSIDVFETQISNYSSEMIQHFQLLLHLLHKMAKSPEAQGLYDILTEEKDYEFLLSNWDLTTRRSSFLEEMFYYHYYLTNNEVRINQRCRIGTIIIERKNYREIDATMEEKTIYYIIVNIMTKITISLQQLSEVTEKILTDYSNESKVNLLTFNIIILFMSIILYLSSIGYISLLRQINEIIMTQFFSKTKEEDEFNADVERLKRVIMHFNKNECELFEESKGKSNPFLLKTTDIGISFFHNMKTIGSNTLYQSISNNNIISTHNKNSKNQTSTLYINKASRMKSNHQLKMNRLAIGRNHQGDNNKKINIESEAVNQSKKVIQRLSKMRFMNASLFSISSLLIIFSAIQITNIFIITMNSNTKNLENIASTYFLMRIPKFAELVLYTEISVLVKSLTLVIPNMTEEAMVNYYDIKLNANNNSFINQLQNKNFVYLYNQLYIIRQNLHYFLNDNSVNNLFPIIQEIERKFQSETFCETIGVYYVQSIHDSHITNLVSFFAEVSNEGQACRIFGEGINLSGLKVVLDLLIQHLYTMYVDYEITDRDKEAQRKFLEDNLLELVIDSLQSTMGSVHKSFAYFTLIDVIESSNDKYRVEVIMSVISMIVSSGMFAILLMILVKSFENHNTILENFWLKIDRAVRLKQVYKEHTEIERINE